MSILRFFATIFLLLAVIALVADATPYLASQDTALKFTSLEAYWRQIAPATFKSFLSWIEASAALAWMRGPILAILNVPAVITFGCIGLMSGWFGRRRDRVRVFAN